MNWDKKQSQIICKPFLYERISKMHLSASRVICQWHLSSKSHIANFIAKNNSRELKDHILFSNSKLLSLAKPMSHHCIPQILRQCYVTPITTPKSISKLASFFGNRTLTRFLGKKIHPRAISEFWHILEEKPRSYSHINKLYLVLTINARQRLI